jgi:hypothetical protein
MQRQSRRATPTLLGSLAGVALGCHHARFTRAMQMGSIVGHDHRFEIVQVCFSPINRYGDAPAASNAAHERPEGWSLSSHALALGRLDTTWCQRVNRVSSGAIFMSAKRPPMSIATSAVMSAIVKRSSATKWFPFSSRSIRSRR